MNNTALNTFVTELSQVWGPLTSELTKQSKQLLETLAINCKDEDWLNDLAKNKYPAKEIYRSKEHGFILMGHVEDEGEQSPPHDHGNGWVLYSTVTGNVEMGIFHKVISTDGNLNLVQKDAYDLKPGECSVYLPGDIHDTTSKVNGTVMLRLTSCDFSKEVEEGRLVKYQGNVKKW